MKPFIAVSLLLLSATTAVAASDASDLVGHYYLQHIREVGSELVLVKNGTFQWALSYGAEDQFARGRWQLKGDQVTLISELPPEAPTYRLFTKDELRISRPAEPGSWIAIVGVPGVGPVAGVEVVFQGTKGPLGKAVSQPNGDAILLNAPAKDTWVRAGLRRANTQDALQWIDIPADRAADRIAGFVVDDPSKVIPSSFEQMTLTVQGADLVVKEQPGWTYSRN